MVDQSPSFSQLTPKTAQLRLLNGTKAGTTFPLHRIRTVIGRSDPPHIQVDFDLSDYTRDQDIPPTISRRHAIIEWVNGELQIIDLASKNGTTVDGQPLTATNPSEPASPTSLQLGSTITCGNLQLEVINHE